MKKILLAIVALGLSGSLWAGEPLLPRPLTLDDALSFALAHNPALNAVKAQLKEQEGVLVETTAEVLPRVGLEGAFNWVDKGLQETDAARAAGTRSWSAQIVARHTLFSGGSGIGSLREQLARKQAATARAKEAVEETILRVKEDFYSVLVARQMIAVRAEAMEVLEEQLGDVSAKYEAGVASQFEKLQAQVALANARPELIRAQNSYRLAVDGLLATLGAPQNERLSPEEVVGELYTDSLPNLDEEQLLELAARHRPQLRAANRDFAAAQSAVWSARGSYLPKVDLFAGYGYQKSALSSYWRDDIEGWNAGVSVTLPLFDGFKNAAGVYAAKARKRRAAAIDLQTRLGVDLEVRQAHSNYTQAAEILSYAVQVVDEARESLRLSKARYEVGSSTQLDVLQAQSALSQARLTLLQAQYDATIAQAKLQKATGSPDWNMSNQDEK